eukprot:Opistho-2@27678
MAAFGRLCRCLAPARHLDNRPLASTCYRDCQLAWVAGSRVTRGGTFVVATREPTSARLLTRWAVAIATAPLAGMSATLLRAPTFALALKGALTALCATTSRTAPARALHLVAANITRTPVTPPHTQVNATRKSPTARVTTWVYIRVGTGQHCGFLAAGTGACPLHLA